jgi:hypothetical protein
VTIHRVSLQLSFICFNCNLSLSVSHCSLAKSTTSNELMHKINRDSVSVMMSLNVADAEPSRKRAKLVERQVRNYGSWEFLRNLSFHVVGIGSRLSGSWRVVRACLDFIQLSQRRP